MNPELDQRQVQHSANDAAIPGGDINGNDMGLRPVIPLTRADAVPRVGAWALQPQAAHATSGKSLTPPSPRFLVYETGLIMVTGMKTAAPEGCCEVSMRSCL